MFLLGLRKLTKKKKLVSRSSTDELPTFFELEHVSGIEQDLIAEIRTTTEITLETSRTEASVTEVAPQGVVQQLGEKVTVVDD